MERFIRPVIFSNRKLFAKKQSGFRWFLLLVISAMFFIPMTIHSNKNDRISIGHGDWTQDLPMIGSELSPDTIQEPAAVELLAEKICNINGLQERDQLIKPQTRIRIPNGAYTLVYTVTDPATNTAYKIAKWFEQNREEARKLGPTE